MKDSFTVEKTNIAKGVACLLLLCHHIFYPGNIERCTFVFGIAKRIMPMFVADAKVCVAIFLLLSGYGLTKSYYKSNLKGHKFVILHLSKLMLQYWFIFIIFVPLSFVFGGEHNPLMVYGTGFGAVGRFIIDFCGMANLFGSSTMNATWWYMGTIIPLYCVFPILYKGVKKYPIAVLLFALFLAVVNWLHLTRYAYAYALLFWIFPFMLGIWLAEFRIIENIINQYPIKQRIVIFFMGVICLACMRLDNGIAIDGFFAFCIIMFADAFVEKLNFVKKILAFIGKQSANIFMMHTFIFSYFFKNFFYAMKYPVIIYSAILVSCILISILIERLKNITHYNCIGLKIKNILLKEKVLKI